MTLPKTYKAAVAVEVGKPLQIKEVPLKKPGEGEILVKVEACGVCHSDSGLLLGHMGTLPCVPGHEIIGRAVELGPGADKRFKKGSRIGAGWHGGHDLTCRQCEKGLFQMCDNATVNGIFRDGGYAEYVILRAEAAVVVPEEVDAADYAAFLCAGVTVFNSVRNMGIEAGGTVAIQGLGGLGHLAVQYCRKMGFRTVALSRDDSKKEFATSLGATDYISGDNTAEQLQKIGGADLIVVTAPNPKIIPDLVNGLRATGTLLLLTPIGEVSINTIPMILKGIKVRGWPSGSQNDSEAAVEFALRNDVKCLVEKFPLEKAQEAYEYMMAGKPRFRAVLTM